MEYPNGIYLYGKLNKEITIKEYEGSTTDTSTTSVIDSTIKVDVIKVPNKLTIKEAEDLFQTFDGSKEVVVDLTPYAKEVQLLDSVELVSTSSDQNKLIFRDKSGNEITSVDISGFTQIQADWNQEDTASEAYIKNKPTKLSQFENDGDGTSPFATEAYVEENGGKIDSISLNDVNLPIDSNKNVNIKAVEPLEGTYLVYTENGTNQTTGVAYTSSKDPNTIPIRDSDGNIEVGAITETSSLDLATNKGYVDSQNNKKLDKTGGIIEGTLNVKENLNVTGNLNVSGTATAVKTQSLLVIDNVIATNADKQELTTLLSGLALNKNANETYGLMYDPADNTVKFGQGALSDTGVFTFNAGEGKPLAIRAQSTELNEGHLIKWDSTTNSFVDSGKTVTDFTEIQDVKNIISETITQEAGQATDKAMSQKAVTDELNKKISNPVVSGNEYNIVTFNGKESGTLSYSNEPTPSSVVQRDENGRTQAEDGIGEKDVVNLGQLSAGYEKIPEYVLIEKVITGYTVLETEPEDFTTNYASYYKTNGKARNDIDFNYVALTEAETFETGKYYSKTTEKANLFRFGESGKELDGTPYAFKNIFINFENSNTTLGVWDPIHFYVGNRPTDAIYYGGLGLGVQTNKSQVNADMQGNAVNIYAMALSAENNATKLQFRKREIISETNPVLDGIKIHSLFPDTIVLIYGARV